jgi:energy-converting hydrogenase B subunit D
MDILTLGIIIMAILQIAAAIYAVIQKDLLYAVIATSVISLILSIFFYILQAPDVALTEAAIGAALTTIIFVITIRNTERYEDKKHIKVGNKIIKK